ncbi:hypothetical protein BpHYR1_046958 [Brachionus plicatilis]|uniref:MARVEL domain-containing protein n=1 Tax=Brachionus plicatilis TaxID=10195 RepID=A0A3M7SD68_BRAPC|nr:hypothetical protein BpHYR1_046958 [Brachionus plicatilis]
MPELNKEYLSPKSGFLRIALIVVLLAAWISAAAAGNTGYRSNRDAFLAFAIIGFVLSIIILVLNILNLIKIPAISSFPWIIIFAVLDAIMLLAMFIVSIVLAVTAGKYGALVKRGAFWVAAIFGFISCVLYAVILVLTGLQIKKSGGIKVSMASNAQQGSSATA